MPPSDEATDINQPLDVRMGKSNADGASPTVVDSLFYEQGRLRAELDRLRSDQTAGRARADANEKEKPGQGEQSSSQPDAKSKDAPASDQKTDGADKDKDDKKEGDAEKKDAPKEPLLTRTRKWAAGHPISTVAIPFLLIAVLIGGWFLWRYLQSYESTDDAQVDGHLNAVSSRITGTVIAVNVENDQTVDQGKLAVELDTRDYDVALAQQKANLEQADANIQVQNPSVSITQTTQKTSVSSTELDVTTARAGYVAQQQQVLSSLADLRQAEANAANAAADELRYRKLVEKAEVSRETYEQKLADARAQAAMVSSRSATADVASKTVDQRKAALEQAIALAAQAKQNSSRQNAVQKATTAARQAAAHISKAQVDQAVLNLAYCKIYIPVNGVIGNKTVEVGAQVSVGQELFDVTPIKDLWITANYKETQLRKMRPGQSVTVYVDTLGRDFQGYIENMPGATGARYSLLPPDNATGNYVKVVQRLPVRIRLKPDQDGIALLRTGMSVEPKVWLR